LKNIETPGQTWENIDIIIEWPEEGSSDEAPSMHDRIGKMRQIENMNKIE